MSTVCVSGDVKLDNAVNQWLKIDKNADTRTEVANDVKNARWDKLRKTMLGRQKFGTAGLRAKMAAGYKCMNDVVVLQTAQGLCSYIKKVCNQGQLSCGIVIGYDGRYNSKRFAELTAKVFVSASIPVRLFSDVCPTPLVSFAAATCRGVGGVMVTASHNPKEDNGYKVYWGNGSQIITPHDNAILEEITQNLEIPDEHWDTNGIRDHALVTDCRQDVLAKYLKYITNSLAEDVLETNRVAAINTVYTAMHGVGYEYILKAFEAANLEVPFSVRAQQEPDPDFPTVTFPNPEEPACLRLSQELAEERQVRLLLANDPDADRLAVAEYDVGSRQWTVFTGNEMGALLGWWLLQQYKKKPTHAPHDVFFIASVVSSKMLRAIAKADKCQFVETLTGFKWMGNTTLILAKEGKLPLFAFEEAIGYMCDAQVPDKDGVTAAVQVASLASHLYRAGGTLRAQLQALYRQYGYHVSHNKYYVCHDPNTIQRIFRRIRNYHAPGEYPKRVGSCEVASIYDLTTGVRIPDDGANGDGGDLHVLGTGLDLEYNAGEMIMFRCTNGLSVTVRTSGTEPKIKYYTELCARADTTEEQEKLHEDMKKTVEEFIVELLQPTENGLLE